MKFTLRWVILTLLVMTGLGGVLVASPARAVTPCCSIVAIEAKTGVVTAKVTATGKTFQFKANAGKLLNLTTLKIGQAVSVDFTTMKVSVEPDGGDPCCNIVQSIR